jgi:MFS transporter, DHA1 family, multidrug resistance protein
MARMAAATVPLVRRMRLPADVALLCLVIGLASIVTGISAPTFPLRARALRLDLATIGWLPASSGFVSLCLALPLGLLSDRVGRRRVVAGGIFVFALGMFCVGVAQGLPLLLAGSLLFGAAGPSTFPIGAALLGDVTTPGQRVLAFGLYTTAMGVGFTIGPLIGGQVAERAGTGAAFIVGAAVAVVDGTLALLVVPALRPNAARARAGRSLRGILALARRPDLALACLGTLLMGWTFNGAISTFFPLYGDALGLSAATIGALFALRAFVSAFGRLPNGLLARALGNQAVMLAALILDALAMVALAFAHQTWLLAVPLLGEGLAFGAYLVAGQTFVADRTTVENRGTAVGLYAMAGSLGSTAAPASLGAVADRWGLAATFGITSALLAVGIVVVVVGMIGIRNTATT